MARRTVWLVTGVVAGAASSLYAERKLKQTLEAASARLAPESLVGEVGRTARKAARSTGGRVRAAVATGRSEMQRREDELWAVLAASGAVDVPDGTGAAGTGTARPTGVADPAGVADGTPGTGDDSALPDGPAGAVAVGDGHGGRGRSRRRARRSPSHLAK